MLFLKNVDRTRFEGLRTDLHNRYIRGLLRYPQDLAAAYAMITIHRLTATTTPTRTETSGLSFLRTNTGADQNDTGQGQRAPQEQIAPIVGTGGKLHASLRCYACKGFGHYARHCPGEAPATTTGPGFLQMETETKDGDA